MNYYLGVMLLFAASAVGFTAETWNDLALWPVLFIAGLILFTTDVGN